MWRPNGSLFLVGVALALAVVPAEGQETEPLEFEEREEEQSQPPVDLAVESRRKQVQKGLAELRDQQRKREEAEPLVERSLDLVQKQNYVGARAALTEWEQVDGSDRRIDPLRRLVFRLETEQDPGAREALLREYVSVMGGNIPASGASPGARGAGGDSAQLSEELCVAAAGGDIGRMDTLLSQGASANSKDRFGTAALLHAAGAGKTEAVSLLLRRGADVNARGFMGATSLTLAAAKGYADTVQVLLDSGADVKARTDSGTTALDSARFRGHKEVEELLTGAGAAE